MRQRILAALFSAAAITGLTALNIMYRADNVLSDALYQRAGLSNRDIVVIGIDQETIDALGPVTGLRGAMAQALDRLNAVSEDRPAVIGIDIMYTGENRDAPEADRLLAETAGKYDNIVVAADARFGSDLVAVNDGSYTLRQDRVIGWYEPYAALRNVAAYGHINQSLDRDGIFRHARLYVDVPETGRVFSFAKTIYDLWCENTGAIPNPLPQTSAEGYYYLPFSSTVNGYDDGFNFLKLFNGEINPFFYRGKIVLIGPTAPGMQDEYFTSLNHAVKTPGVVIQANIVEAMQKGFYPEELRQASQLTILFVITFLLAFYLWDRRIIPSALAWLILCAGWIGLCRLCYDKAAVILHVLWVPAGASILFVFSISFNYVRSQREKRRVTDTFGHYIDPAIRDQLLARGADAMELGGVTRDIAVLFVDVRGFTSMSEALDAQTVVEIVNRYLTLTTDCIMKNHGTLDKFVGDCTMAIWNAPLEQAEPVYLACQAAMDMIAGSKALGDELMQRFGRTVSFGVGIHWGPAVVGNIGAPKRLDYTAIGDTVNTAARLEANAPGGTILVSRAVADMLGEKADVTSLGDSIPLKGKSTGFEVLKLNSLCNRI